MKKHLFALGSVVTLAIILTGCSPVKWKGIGYLSPATEVNLKSNPSINITAFGNKKMLSPLVAKIQKEFAKSGQFKIDSKAPDYWVVLNGETGFRIDDAQTAQYNKRTVKKQKTTSNGGFEYLASSNFNSSASTKFLSVAIYSVKDLAPVHYFDIAIYDADFNSGKVRGKQAYDADFSHQIMAKIKDSFLVQKRTVDTAIPKAADDDMIDALLKGDAKAVIERAKALKLDNFNNMVKDIKAGKYKGKEEALEELLCNYYVLALAKEIDDFAPANLRKLHSQHVTILNYAQEEALIEAVPNTLARIESKLKLLQALK